MWPSGQRIEENIWLITHHVILLHRTGEKWNGYSQSIPLKTHWQFYLSAFVCATQHFFITFITTYSFLFK